MLMLEKLPEEAAILARLMELRGPLGVISSLLLFYRWGAWDSESSGDFPCETSLYHLSLWGSEDVLIFKGETWLQQPKCPTTDGGVENSWHIYTTEYYSAMKRNAVGSCVETWVDLESHTEWTKAEKNKHCTLMHICGVLKIGRYICVEGRNRDTDVEWTWGHRGRRGWDELGDWKLTYVH